MKEYLLVGIYMTTDVPGRGEDTIYGKGVYCYSHDSVTSQIGDMADTLEMESPSYLMADKSEDLLFAVNRTGNVSVVVPRPQKEGELEVVDHLSFDGAAAYHVTYEENRGLLAIANYMNGSMSIATVRDRQKLECRLHTWYQGRGSIEARQEMSRVHSYLFYEDCLLMTDLGLDRVHLYRMVDGKIEFLEGTGVRTGGGPRHVTVCREGDGTWFYVVNELPYDVSVYRFRMGEFQEIQREPLYDGLFVKGSLVADIHITKNGIPYAPLCGADQVVWSQIQHGSLRRMGSMDSGGEGSRSFCFDREEWYLITVNQLSDNLAVYPVERRVIQKEAVIHFPVSAPVKVLAVQG